MARSRGLRAKLQLLRLAARLKNVDQACRQLSFSRDSFYRYQRLFESGGEAALRSISRRKPNLDNRVDRVIEEAAVVCAHEHPTWGPVKAAEALAERRLAVSPSGVRGIWLRHGLATAAQRLAAQGALVTGNGAAADRGYRYRSVSVEQARAAGRGRAAARLGENVGDRSRDQASSTASALLRIALDLFAARNYSTVTIKDIAEATGMNASLIYYYFGNKEGLFLKVVEAAADDAFNSFVVIRNDGASPREIISLWIENHILQYPLMQKLIKISIDHANTHSPTPKIDRAIRKFYDIEARVLGGAIRDGIAEGLFAPVVPERMAEFISTFLDGALVRSVMMNEFDAAAAIRDMRDVVLRRLVERVDA